MAMTLNAIADLTWVNPCPGWYGTTWHAGHLFSGREPSSAKYNPDVNARVHAGWDIAAPLSSPMVAPREGIVEYIGRNDGAGNFIVIRHQLDASTVVYSRHLHALDAWTVQIGDVVEAGDQIGLVGSTGASAGPHDHMDIYIKNIGHQGWVPRMRTADGAPDRGILVDPELAITGRSPGYRDGTTVVPWRAPVPSWGEDNWEHARAQRWITPDSHPDDTVTKLELMSFLRRVGR